MILTKPRLFGSPKLTKAATPCRPVSPSTNGSITPFRRAQKFSKSLANVVWTPSGMRKVQIFGQSGLFGVDVEKKPTPETKLEAKGPKFNFY